MAELSPEESRQTDRKRVLKGAKICFAARCASLPCVVRDISDTGARLQVKDHASVPDSFELIIELDGFEVDAEVVWRREGEVGIIFLNEPVVGSPTRTQIVESSVPKKRATLRRQKPTATRRGATESHTLEQEVVADEMTTSPEVVCDTDTAQDESFSVDEQVNALTTSLGILEIAESDVVESAIPESDQAATAMENALLDCVVDDQLNAEENEISAPVQNDTANVDLSRELSLTETEQDPASHPLATPTLGETQVEGPEIVAEGVDMTKTSELHDAPVAMSSDLEAPVAQPEDPEVELTSVSEPFITPPSMDLDPSNVEFSDGKEDVSEVNSDVETSVSPISTVMLERTVAEVPMFRDQIVETEDAPAVTATAVPASLSTTPEPVAKDDVPSIEFELPRQDEAESSLEQIVDARSIEETVPDAADEAVSATANALVEIVDDGQTNGIETLTQSTPESALEHVDVVVSPDEEVADTVEDAFAAPLVETVEVADEDQSNGVETDDPVTEPSSSNLAEPQEDSATTSPDALRPDLAAFVELFAVPSAPSADEAPAHVQDVADVAAEKVAETAGEPRDNVVQLDVSEAQPVLAAIEVPGMEIVDEAIYVSAPQPTSCDVPAAIAPTCSVATPEDDVAETIAPLASKEFLASTVDDNLTALETPTVPVETEPEPASEIVAELEVPSSEDLVVEDEASTMEMTACADTDASTESSPDGRIPILVAEDDPDDRMFMREAFQESSHEHDIEFVNDGEELLAYLNGEGEYADRPKPGLILLDLNMPRMDGRTALLHIKANPCLRRIPVIVLTTSKAEDDIEKTYDLGVSSYISKPSSAEGLKEVIATLDGYWSTLVALPTRN